MILTPEIAIIDENTLAAMGLRDIMKGLMPDVMTKLFPCFEALIDDTPDMYKHYFVSADIYLNHTEFFSKRKYRTIVLSEGERPMFKDIPHLNVCQPLHLLCKSISILKKEGHDKTLSMHKAAKKKQYHEVDTILTKREIEVLRLVIKGYINKEVAKKLDIGLTTVITHRKNMIEKLGIKSVPELTIYAFLHGIITMDEM